MAVNNIFDNTLAPNPVTSYTLFRGVTDYTNLAQFDLYETGYSFLVLLQIPIFMDKLQALSQEKGGYQSLIQNYRHIIEYEFRGAQGIDDITGDTSPLTNGLTDLNIITRVTEQGGSQFTMNYFERSGSIITKTHELFLRGVKDPRTQVKRYNGLLTEPLTNRSNQVQGATTTQANGNTSQNLMQDKGYQYEVFHFLLIVTDNTALNVEKAYILASCQPTIANTTIYNVTRGEIQFQEMGVQFQGLPIPGRIVNQRAVEFLKYINQHTCFDEMDFGYNILSPDALATAAGTNGNSGSYVEAIEAKNSGGTAISSPTVDSLNQTSTTA
jgi:hypothetical protein